MKIQFTTNQKNVFLLKKISLRTLAVIQSIAILNLNFSCSYYTVKDRSVSDETISSTIDSFNKKEKYVIIHAGSESWHLQNVVINDDEKFLGGILQPIDENHLYKKPRDSKKVHRYNPSNTDPLNEIHFYIKNDYNFLDNKSTEIPLSAISRISVNDKNTGRTIANITLSVIGSLFVGILLVAALKSSCPFLYIKNGENFDFVGELYPGTITANMQRDDFLPLPPMSDNEGICDLKICNYLKEIQYTDLVELITVNHEPNVEVLIDSKGNIQTFSAIERPSKVILDDGTTEEMLITNKDNEYYAFNSTINTRDGKRFTIFEFDNPIKNKEAKLYITAKNSVWLDYIFGKFNEQFGSYYNTFQRKQQDMSRDSLINWSQKQNIPLSVYLKTTNGWELVEKLNTVGPMALRNLAIPIDLKKLNSDKVIIKLETGFMFWELDYIGIDYTKNRSVKIDNALPLQALDQNNNEVTDQLSRVDGNYLVQPNIGDEVVVSFRTNRPEQHLVQSRFLKSRGYYNYIRNYRGIPDREQLESFREDNAFTRFSETAYFDFINYKSDELVYNE